MKKTVSFILAALMLAAMLVGCGSTTSTSTTAAAADTTAAGETAAAFEGQPQSGAHPWHRFCAWSRDRRHSAGCTGWKSPNRPFGIAS